MTDFPVLRDLGYLILGATVLLLAARPLRVPPIVAYILAGLLLGPVLGLLVVSESLELMSELGIALLLFVVGLELSVQRLRDVGRPALVGGVLQVGLTFVLGAAAAFALGFTGSDVVFLGLAVTFSSTVVVIKLLDRAGDLGALYGRISIGILLVQDVLVAAVLTLVSALGAGGEGAPTSIPLGLAQAFLGLTALAAGAAAAVRWVLPRLFEWLAESTEALFIASLTWAFAFIVAAETIHISIELGAFVAGVSLAQLPYNDDLRRRIHPLVDFFLAVFFVSIGAEMDLGAAGRFWVAALVLPLFVLLVKPLLIGWLMVRLGYAGRTAFLTGLTLGQVSEFAFILMGLAVGAGLAEPALLSLVGVVGLTTMAASASAVPMGDRLYRWGRGTWLPGFFSSGGREEATPETREGHVVVVGMNTLGRLLVRELAARGERVLAVDSDPEKLRDLPAEITVGSVESLSVLEEIGLQQAKLVVSALQIEDANSLLAYRCSKLGVPVSIHAFDPSLAHELLEIGADHLMVSKHDGIRQMAEELRRLGVTS